MKFLRSIAAFAGVCTAAAMASAAAQQPPSASPQFWGGPSEIVLYDFPNFQGRSVTLNAAAENLTRQQFNDMASSIRVVSGTWEVCFDDVFRGRCMTIGEDQRTLGIFDNQITSVRPVTDSGGPGPGLPYDSLTLYEGVNFSGRSVTLTDATADFNRINFNDRARSVRLSGTRAWQVCQHANYRGTCAQITGEVRDLAVLRLSGQISSAAPAGGRPGGPGGPGWPGRPDQPHTGAWLFTGTHLAGARFEVASDLSDFSRTNFNDRANSLIVARGETWEFCEHANYRGRCVTAEGDSIDNLAMSRLGNAVSSARRVDGRYGGGYPGRPGWDRLNITGGVQGTDAVFFPAPMANGQYIDRCLGTGGRDCDTVAADAVCRAAGFREAAYFSVDQGRRYRTWHLGQRTSCTTGRCEAMLDLVCLRN